MRLILLLFGLAIISGCSLHPRFQQQREQAEESRDHQKAISWGQETSPDLTTAENLRLGMIIQEYLGTPYRGRSEHSEGLDCSRLMQLIFEDYSGLDLPRTVMEQYSKSRPLKRDFMRFGDLVFFKINGEISHVGLYIGFGEFVHSSASSGVMISSLSDKYWKKGFAAAGRVVP